MKEKEIKTLVTC